MTMNSNTAGLRGMLFKTCCLASLIALSGCATAALVSDRNNNVENNAAYVTAFPEVNVNQIASNATWDVFKVGDTADIHVYNVESLTNTYVVDRAGNINFPLIGSMQVAGLNTTELQQRLTQSYGAQLLRSPSINVKIEAQDLGRIVVDGAVNGPGVFDVNNIIKLSEAIALAQGLNEENTNGSSVYIVRTVNSERKVMEVDLRDIRKLGAADPQIIPNDVIFVQDSAGRIAFKEFIKTLPLLNSISIIATR